MFIIVSCKWESKVHNNLHMLLPVVECLKFARQVICTYRWEGGYKYKKSYDFMTMGVYEQADITT